jgi:hypothetical protein
MFSLASFTGVDANITSTTVSGRLLASLESFLGLGFIVLFVFVLTRRMTD